MKKQCFNKMFSADCQYSSFSYAGSFSPASATKKAVSCLDSNTSAFFLNNNRDKNGTSIINSLGLDGNSPSLPKKKMPSSEKQNLLPSFIRRYTTPKLHTGKCWYIDFTCLDPASGTMRRKRIKINHISNKKTELRKYAQDLCERISEELRVGWNPFLKFESENAYTTFELAVESYKRYLAKLVEEDIMRQKTFKGYISMLKVFLEWKDSLKVKKEYIYQFNPQMCNSFIDHLWLELGRSGTTRDNYVIWLKTFAKFLLQKQYIDNDPTVSLSVLGKKKSMKKNRTVISDSDMIRLKDYALERKKHFLLACYILYYCFIRPREMSFIKLSDISVKKGTIFVSESVAKNKKDGTITLPDCVLSLMVDLDIFKYPSSFYLFSNGMMPGKEYRSDKQFRDFWSHYVRKDLKFPAHYKFYSLKDTGITDLIRDNTDLVSVRNQARHYSLLMTDIYTPRDIQEANELIRHRKAAF